MALFGASGHTHTRRMERSPPDLDPQAAARRIANYAVRTPFIHSHALSERVGLPVWLKLETLQRTGSFKFRGAINRLLKLDPQKRRRGVVAWSSGNHGQAVALAGRLLGIPVTVVMPSDAPAIKTRLTLRHGATVVPYDRYRESREEIARRIAAERRATLVPSFDDYDIIEGQATVGLEIADQSREAGVQLDACLVPCGGGGLIAGCALALHEASPEVRVVAVEPDGFDDTGRSLQTQVAQRNDSAARSICDSLLAPAPGGLTFPINRRLLAGAAAVSDNEVLAAIRFAAESLRLVVEPGGAVALAAVLSGKFPPVDRDIAIVLSGGNIDSDIYVRALSEEFSR